MTALRKAALAATLLAAAPVAPASASCFGSDSTAVVCLFTENIDVDPDGGSTVGDCVVIADPENCIPVFVTLPSAGTSGPLFSYDCNACSDIPGTIGPVVGAIQPTLERANQIIENATKIECAPAHSPSSEQAYAPPDVMDNIRNFIASCT